MSRLLQYALIHQVLGIPYNGIVIRRTAEGKPYLLCLERSQVQCWKCTSFWFSFFVENMFFMFARWSTLSNVCFLSITIWILAFYQVFLIESKIRGVKWLVLGWNFAIIICSSLILEICSIKVYYSLENLHKTNTWKYDMKNMMLTPFSGWYIRNFLLFSIDELASHQCQTHTSRNICWIVFSLHFGPVSSAMKKVVSRPSPALLSYLNPTYLSMRKCSSD